MKQAQEAQAASNLLVELKSALIPKAKEHRMREAKVLGREVEEDIEVERNKDNTEKIDASKNETGNDTSSIENDIPQRLIPTPKVYQLGKGLDFRTQLANVAALRSREFKVVENAECFGDSEDEKSEDDEVV